MKYFIMILLGIGFLGCSGEQMAHSITKTQIAVSGNKPPASFEIANVETMRDYVFNTKDFSFSLPSAKQSDFTKMGGWWGASDRDGKTITLHLHPVYHITISTPLHSYKYTERERAIEVKNTEYIRNRKKWLQPKDKLYIKNYGKENYICTNTVFTRGSKKQSVYNCYKFNDNRTKSKNVVVSLTYNKPKDKTLAKQYTYQDLQNRAKRVLDSLYIKDGWSK